MFVRHLYIPIVSNMVCLYLTSGGMLVAVKCESISLLNFLKIRTFDCSEITYLFYLICTNTYLQMCHELVFLIRILYGLVMYWCSRTMDQ